MKLVVKLIILLLGISLGHIYLVQAQSIKFENVLTGKGLTRNVHCITQTQDGFLWFGTEAGLLKYDGYEYEIFKYLPHDTLSLGNSMITRIFEDKNGTLWIGTRQGINRLEKSTETFKRFQEVEYVNCIYETRKGKFLIGTNQGLLFFDRKTEQITHHYNKSKGLSDNVITSILEDIQGKLWIGTEEGLNKLDIESGEVTVFRHRYNEEKSLSSDRVTAIFADKWGTLWVGTQQGLNRFDPHTRTFTTFRHDINNTTSLSNDEITYLLEDTHGSLWIATRYGLNHFNPIEENFTQYFPKIETTRNSLDKANITELYEDRSGVIWLATRNRGVHKMVKTRKFYNYKHRAKDPNSLSGNTVRTIYEDANGNAWFGIYNGGLCKLDRQTGKFKTYFPYPDSEESELNSVTSILEETPGVFWIGTWGGGILKFNEKQERFFEDRETFPYDYENMQNNQIQFIRRDSQNRFWVGTDLGLQLYDPKTQKRQFFQSEIGKSNSLASGGLQPQGFYEERNGIYWFGSWGGLTRYDESQNKFTRFSQLPNYPIITIKNKGRDSLCLGTYDGGIIFLNIRNHKFKTYTEADGLPDNTVYSILEDEERNLWLSTNHGLSKFHPNSGTFTNYSATDGLQGDEFYWGSGFRGKYGRMYFGGVNGVTVFDPKNIRDNTYIPPVVLTHFKIFYEDVLIQSLKSPLKKHISLTDKIELEHTDYIISFRFSALDFTDPEKNQYAYKLEGFDEDWIHTDFRNREITYMNLPADTYIFRIKGANNDGVWNHKGQAIKLIIHPPIWMELWFQIGCIILGAGVVFLIYKIRVQNIQRQKAILEKLVEERTASLQEANKNLSSQKEEMAAINEDLKQQKEEIAAINENLSEKSQELAQSKAVIEKKNADITASINYAQRIQQTLLPPFNEIKAELSDFFILFRPRDGVSGDFYWFDSKDDKIIVAAIDCTGHGVPGAIMSMIGIEQLTEIVNVNGITEPDEILNALHYGVRTILRQKETGNRDGMDMALCVIDKEQNQLSFSGAKNPLVYIQKNQLFRIRGDKHPIGGKQVEKLRKFTKHIIDISEPTTIYLFSDGYQDQFGGRNGMKFMSKRFRQLLFEIHLHPPKEQQRILETTLDAWMMHKHKQLDDILVMGVKIS